MISANIVAENKGGAHGKREEYCHYVRMRECEILVTARSRVHPFFSCVFKRGVASSCLAR